MKGRPIDQLVYERMFPKSRPNEPPNFHSLLQRYLVVEVRQEVLSFYGHLDDQEAKYPGLDYCNRTHRIRLSRWPWHRRLFRAFDDLRLTKNEIASLTKWEGTKWAKDRFERDSGISISDTANEGFPTWSDEENRAVYPNGIRPTLHGDVIEENAEEADVPEDEDMDAAEEDEEADQDEDESEGELESVGIALNERLRERAARREPGDISTVLDEEWEQWLKNAIETGEMPFITDQILQSSTSDPSWVPASLFPRGMLNSAREGRWHEVPDFLHQVIRRILETETPSTNLAQASRTVDQPLSQASSISSSGRELPRQLQDSEDNNVVTRHPTNGSVARARLLPLGARVLPSTASQS